MFDWSLNRAGDIERQIEVQKQKVAETPSHYYKIKMEEEQKLRELENQLRLHRYGRP